MWLMRVRFRYPLPVGNNTQCELILRIPASDEGLVRLLKHMQRTRPTAVFDPVKDVSYYEGPDSQYISDVL